MLNAHSAVLVCKHITLLHNTEIISPQDPLALHSSRSARQTVFYDTQAQKIVD